MRKTVKISKENEEPKTHKKQNISNPIPFKLLCGGKYTDVK